MAGQHARRDGDCFGLAGQQPDQHHERPAVQCLGRLRGRVARQLTNHDRHRRQAEEGRQRIDLLVRPYAFAETFDPNNPGVCETRLGTSGFNNLRSAGVFNWDFGLFRDFAITERVHLQFRAEAFNFTNTPHYDYPDNYIGDANAIDQKTGKVTDPGTFMTIQGVQDLAREGIDERQFRIGLRISF